MSEIMELLKSGAIAIEIEERIDRNQQFTIKFVAADQEHSKRIMDWLREFPTEVEFGHFADCRKIQLIAARELHVVISLKQAESAWREWHRSRGLAGWAPISETAECVLYVKEAVEADLQKAFKKIVQVLGSPDEQS